MLQVKLPVTAEITVQCKRTEVFRAMEKSVVFFWVVTLSGLEGTYRHFGGKRCLHMRVAFNTVLHPIRP